MPDLSVFARKYARIIKSAVEAMQEPHGRYNKAGSSISHLAEALREMGTEVDSLRYESIDPMRPARVSLLRQRSHEFRRPLNPCRQLVIVLDAFRLD